MSKLLLIVAMVIGLGGCATRAGMGYDRQEPMPIDLSSTKFLFGLLRESEEIQVAAVSPSVLAQRARPFVKEYVEEKNTDYDNEYEDDEYDDEYYDEE